VWVTAAGDAVTVVCAGAGLTDADVDPPVLGVVACADVDPVLAGAAAVAVVVAGALGRVTAWVEVARCGADRG
jgi:hypothetical protein